MSNAEQARRYREAIKADPDKLAMLRSKAAERMRKARARSATGAQHEDGGAQQTPGEPSPKLTPEERAARLAKMEELLAEPEDSVALPEDPLARIHREYKAECEALGYDVDGNRLAVQEAIKDKLADPKIRLSPPRSGFRGAPEDESRKSKK